MTGHAAHPLGVTFLSALVLLAVGCGSTPSAGIGIPEPRAQAAPPVRDRELELTSLRAEMAATRIAAAKKEAELQELRDLVRQLRLENAESRQAFLEMRDRAEQRHVEAEKAQEAHTRQVHATDELTVLKETVVTLAQALGQLRQDLANPVVKEEVHRLTPSSAKSRESARHMPRPDPAKLVQAAQQLAAPSVALSPMALTVTAAVPDPPSTIIVRPGDTVASLAKRHRTSVEVLRTLNALTGDGLIVGRALILPTSPQP